MPNDVQALHENYWTPNLNSYVGFGLAWALRLCSDHPKLDSSCGVQLSVINPRAADSDG